MIKGARKANVLVSRRDRADMRAIIAFQAGSKIRDAADEKALDKLGVDIIGMFDIIRQLKDAFSVNVSEGRIYEKVNERSTVGEVLDYMSDLIETDKTAMESKALVIEQKKAKYQQKIDQLRKKERELILLIMMRESRSVD